MIATNTKALTSPSLGVVSFPYSMKYTSQMFIHPKINGRNKLCKFLRDEGIFEDGGPLQCYIDLGYFTVDYRCAPNGYPVYVPMVSSEGVKFIKQLVFAKLGPYETPVKKKEKQKQNAQQQKHLYYENVF